MGNDKLVFCKGCEEMVTELIDEYDYELCTECNDKYVNHTGWCGLSCCLGGGCDQSC